MNELKDYIRCYDGLVDDDWCLDVRKKFDASETSYLDREQRPSFHEFNISQKYIAKDDTWVPIQQKITKTLVDAVEIYMRELDLGPDFPGKYAFEEYRMKMYDTNEYDQFKDHVDVQDYNSARRFLVCFLYLNDVISGGETNFPKINFAITPKCGRIVVFPATWQYRHAGLPPISNRKYIIGSYLHYV